MLTQIESPYVIEDDNVAFLNGEVNADMGEYFMRFVLEKNLKVDPKNPDKPRPDHLKVFINSQGGFVYDGLMIIDMMKAFPIPIWTYGTGLIASCGLLIFMSGEKGHRYLLRNTSILSHQFSGGLEGKNHEMLAGERENKLLSKRIHKLYENTTSLSKEEIDETLLPPSDVWITPKEAVKYGICDKIIDRI